ncbi:AhpC/TSA family protein [Leucothrix sargassi]|nr:AhpC/TSA family protein [Leucothrix sargassi]
MVVLKPREEVPNLELNLVGGGTWSLHDQNPENFTMMVFYRGLHCPVCSMQLKELQRLKADFAERGVNVIAVSSDPQDRAEQAQTDWDVKEIDIAYGLTPDQARSLGLHRSAGRGKTSIGIEEPAEFSEPGLFMVRPDKTLFYASISTMPFARPSFKELLGSLDFVLANNYPARGELV